MIPHDTLCGPTVRVLFAEIEQLALNSSRTLLLQNHPPVRYIDKGLAVIGRTFAARKIRLD